MQTAMNAIAQAPAFGGQLGAAKPTTHRHGMERLAKIASLICSACAGVGVAAGLMSPEDGVLCGILVPTAAGAAIASAGALGWHNIQTAAVRVRTPLGYVAVVAAGFALSAAMIGTSSWAVATVLSGHAAERQHRAEVVAEHQQAIDASWQEARKEGAMIDAASAAQADLRARSDLETRQGRLSSKGKGAGPNTGILDAGAGGFNRLGETMRNAQQGATNVYAKGQEALNRMRANVHGDEAAFADAAAEVETAVANLNGFHLADLASKAGLVDVDGWQANGAAHAVTAGTERVSDRFLQRAKELREARRPVAVPVYEPLEPRQAVLREARGAAAGGWITAAALDSIPYLFALLMLGAQARGPLDEPQIRRRDNDEDARAEFVAPDAPRPPAPAEFAFGRALRAI
jgi:hypothetical protein